MRHRVHGGFGQVAISKRFSLCLGGAISEPWFTQKPEDPEIWSLTGVLQGRFVKRVCLLQRPTAMHLWAFLHSMTQFPFGIAFWRSVRRDKSQSTSRSQQIVLVL